MLKNACRTYALLSVAEERFATYPFYYCGFLSKNVSSAGMPRIGVVAITVPGKGEAMLKRPSFEIYKSTVCHRVKSMGDIAFIADTLKRQEIRDYYDRKWYPESLYLLAMLDYLSRENDIPLCDEYDDLRLCKLEKPIYPASVQAICAAMKNDTAMKRAAKTAIPEFARFNIIENDVRNVV